MLLISQAWLGHAAEGGAGLYGDIMVTVYSIHVIAAGRLGRRAAATALCARGATPVCSYEAREWSLDILSRYSLMAMVAVTLIVASGIANAGFRVAGSFGQLFDTSYGDALFTKIWVVTVMLFGQFQPFCFDAKAARRVTEGHGANHAASLQRSA